MNMFVSKKNAKKGEPLVDGVGKENLLSFPQNLTIFTYVKFLSHSNAWTWCVFNVKLEKEQQQYTHTYKIYSGDVLKTFG